MFITTKARFEWDKDKKEYVEVFTEGFEYEGELALAHQKRETHTHTGGAGDESDARYEESDAGNFLTNLYLGSQGHQGGGIGSRDFDPSEDWLMDASKDDIASGFGLDEGEYGMYFQDFDPWQTELAQDEKDIADRSLEDKYGAEGYETTRVSDLYTDALTNIGRQKTGAGTELSAAFGTATSSMQGSWLDASSQIAARGAQSGFTGAGRGRKGRQVVQDQQRSFTEQASSSTRAYNTMMGDLNFEKANLDTEYTYDTDKMSDLYTTGMDTNALDFLKTETKEQKGYIDDIYDTLGQLAASGAWDEDEPPPDDSCFIAGTKVLMSDGSLKNIEDIQVGDLVKVERRVNEVLALDNTTLGERRLYSINGGKYFVTAEHPFMTKDGWKSIDAKATLKENHLAFSDESSIGTLDVGDILITSGDEIEIESISLKSGDTQMPLYNLVLSGDYTYYADGYLVHNKCCFIVLEVENRDKLDTYVRKYRDEMLNDTNREGYYKLAQVVVPLMRKYKLVKWLFKYSFVAPAKSWAKTYYTGKGIGRIFEPLRKFWLGLFSYLGKNHRMKTDNG